MALIKIFSDTNSPYHMLVEIITLPMHACNSLSTQSSVCPIFHLHSTSTGQNVISRPDGSKTRMWTLLNHRNPSFSCLHPTNLQWQKCSESYQTVHWFLRPCNLFISLPYVVHVIPKLLHFYPNVTTLRSGLCCRNSVCLSSVCRL